MLLNSNYKPIIFHVSRRKKKILGKQTLIVNNIILNKISFNLMQIIFGITIQHFVSQSDDYLLEYGHSLVSDFSLRWGTPLAKLKDWPLAIIQGEFI